MIEQIKIIDKYRELILNAEQYIWKNPETGYKEYKTNAYMIENFEKLGYTVKKAEGITGFSAEVDTQKAGPTVMVIAELDSLINKSHPDCDKETGTVHSCGHNAQCAAMLGIAAALKHKEILDNLCGKVRLLVVPAEEGVEVAYRKQLIEKGVIEFTSGKPEFIKRGFFKGVDIAFMVHAHSNSETEQGKRFLLGTGSNGNARKFTEFQGVSAHAGSNPHDGVNALNVASTAITTVNSLRETFKECDNIRFHSIITKGGDAVNAVPDSVVMESYVRASSAKALKDANEKINRALSAVAAAFGANVKIQDMAGSVALHDDPTLNGYAREVLTEFVGEGAFGQREFLASSTDMGDVSALFPCIHAYACGCSGTLHGKDFRVADPEAVCVDNAKFQLGLLIKLLSNGAKAAYDVIKNYKPVFSSIEEYLAHKRSFNINKQTVKYNQDGTLTLDFKA
ncbi:MAG: amidohydrolase [Clostridiales bacterium]|nr:amidohydrolase [Clostridiales bacterium]